MLTLKLFQTLFILTVTNSFEKSIAVTVTVVENYFTKRIPLVVTTWDYFNATERAWNLLFDKKLSSLDSIESGCSLCERMQCRTTVGYGGSPDERGETTLDAMIMDGVKMDVGAVGGLRNIKNAISVARKVLDHTEHTLLSGELATKFAVEMGFREESLQTKESKDMWLEWISKKCQPNFWKNVSPDPKKFCGPYDSNKENIERILANNDRTTKTTSDYLDQSNHDTIGMIAIDMEGNIAAGTSTNGAKNKISGRIGDSPIPGAGCYADQDIGAAAATGDGDIMMRFLPSFLAVEEMRRGVPPKDATETAIRRIALSYPKFFGAVIAFNKAGEYAAACHGMDLFPYYVSNPLLGEPTLNHVECIN